MNYSTFQEFVAAWREKEATEGTKLGVIVINGVSHIIPEGPVSDEKLQEIWNLAKHEESTGLSYHGVVFGGVNGVLTLKDTGK